MQGPKEVLKQYWNLEMHKAPDLVFTFDARQIKVRSDGTSTLSGSFSMTGTNLAANEEEEHALLTGPEECEYHELHRQFEKQQEHAYHDISQDTLSGSATAQSAHNRVGHSTPHPQSLRIYDKPKVFMFLTSGTITININADWQIEMLEFNIDQDVKEWQTDYMAPDF